MLLSSWRVCITETRVARPSDYGAPEGAVRIFFPEDPFPGSPFLLSPSFEYDVDLNSYFRNPSFVTMSPISQQGYARNIAAFLSFLTSARSGISWRDANEDDHVAYLVWRRRDASGPRVSGATWNREVAAVNNFYRWQCARDSSPRTRSRTMPVVVALIPRAASTIKEVVPRPIREMSTGTTSSGFRKPLIGDGETPE
ncbi:site-specific integrase [Streptomyces luteogriseus]|uniref:site-specific integrase n=2 Tax=Actinomycetota TaxID=201174 RepID=UPI0006BA4AB1|nr:hypothetical protein AWH04_14560 [Rhodococcus erythropolis]